MNTKSKRHKTKDLKTMLKRFLCGIRHHKQNQKNEGEQANQTKKERYYEGLIILYVKTSTN